MNSPATIDHYSGRHGLIQLMVDFPLSWKEQSDKLRQECPRCAMLADKIEAHAQSTKYDG
jgi:predicted dithiol-disulfide oxidoreductase (DUF899 family)